MEPEAVGLKSSIKKEFDATQESGTSFPNSQMLCNSFKVEGGNIFEFDLASFKTEHKIKLENNPCGEEVHLKQDEHSVLGLEKDETEKYSLTGFVDMNNSTRLDEGKSLEVEDKCYILNLIPEKIKGTVSSYGSIVKERVENEERYNHQASININSDTDRHLMTTCCNERNWTKTMVQFPNRKDLKCESSNKSFSLEFNSFKNEVLADESSTCEPYENQFRKYSFSSDLKIHTSTSYSSISGLNMAMSTIEKQHISKSCSRSVSCTSSLSDSKTEPSIPKDACTYKHCKNTVSFDQSFKRNVLTHSNMEQYVCELCNQVFSRKDSLVTHISLHIGVEQYICEYCNISLPDKQHLKYHVLKHTQAQLSMRASTYNCNFCRHTFSWKGNLKRHLLTHSDVKPYTCKLCSKTFSRNCYLMSHMSIHTGIKPIKQYTCEHCKNSFSAKRQLESHISVHTGIKPYTCELCNRSLSDQRKLKCHMLMHEGVQPFICELCNKTFCDKPTIEDHLLIHMGLKPYTCKLCYKSFSWRKSLERHLLVHKGFKPHTCQQCARSFSERSKLKRHMKRRTHLIS